MRKISMIGVSLGIAGALLPVSWASATHIQVTPPATVTYAQPAPQGTVTVVPAPAPTVTTPAPGSVTVVPAPSTVTVVPAPGPAVATPQEMRAEQIRATQVRANTIYANRIEADQVKGIVHHTAGVSVNPTTRGEITGPDVASSVIYADAISANSVVADHIYVRELEMSPSKFVIAPREGGIVVRRQLN